jgi:Flp pilus assembly protein TadG
MVEFALIAPFLVLMLTASADLARGFFMASQMTNAAREGALFAGHHSQSEPTLAALDADTKLAIEQEEQSSYAPLNCIQDTNVTITRASTPTWNSNPPGGMAATPGQNITETITVTCNYHPLLGFLPLPNPVTLHAIVQTQLVS